jgi:transcriptional regulator with XRE-family HTH domain
MRNDALRTARQKRHWTRPQIAKLLGVDERTYRRWEEGSHKPSLENLKKLCNVLNMTPDQLDFDDLINGS